MRHIYQDWIINTYEVEHYNYGRGFKAEVYIAKTNGTKANIRTFGVYDGTIKTHKQMLEYTKNLLDK